MQGLEMNPVLLKGRMGTPQDLFNKLLRPVMAMKMSGKTEEEINEWVSNLTEEQVLKYCRR
jgi:hypothetical protein